MPRGIRRGQNKYALVRILDAVQLGEELVNQLPRASVAQVRPAGAKSVYFIKEQDTGPVGAGAVKEGVQIALALPNPHFQDFIDADGQEPCLDLTGRSAGQVRFAAARRAIQEN